MQIRVLMSSCPCGEKYKLNQQKTPWTAFLNCLGSKFERKNKEIKSFDIFETLLLCQTKLWLGCLTDVCWGS